MRPMTEVMIVTQPVIAKDLRISFELLFQVIDEKIAEGVKEFEFHLLMEMPKTIKAMIRALKVFTLY